MYLKSIKKFGCLFMVFGSSVGMMEIKPIDKPETQQINQETKSKILILNTLAKDSILSNNPALLSKIEEFLGIAEQNLIHTYSQEKIKLTLPADASKQAKTQLIILYNSRSDWTSGAKDLIKSITVEEDGRLLVYNTSKGDLELNAGNYRIINRNNEIVYLTGIFLVNADYSYYGTNDYGCTQIIPVLLNLSREELNKFDANARFNKFTEIKNAITMRRP